MKRVLAVAMFVVFGLATPALAGMSEGDTEIGGGYGSTDVDSDNGIDSMEHFTVRGGHQLNRMFEIEGQFATASDESSILGTNVDSSMNLYMVNGLWNFRSGNDVNPYFLVGLGMADVEVEMGGLSVDDTSVAYQIGGGSRFFFGESKRAAFRLDVSLVTEDSFDESSTHTNITGGFTWKLGGK
jgi:opacity protein-like surface antigen